MTSKHVTPGSIVTVTPPGCVINDSYRERKQPGREHCDHELCGTIDCKLCESERCAEMCLPWLKEHDQQVRKEERERLITQFAERFRSAYFFFDDVKFDETIESLRKEQQQ